LDADNGHSMHKRPAYSLALFTTLFGRQLEISPLWFKQYLAGFLYDYHQAAWLAVGEIVARTVHRCIRL